MIDIVEGGDTAGTEGLAQDNLKNEDGDTNKEEGKHVGDEKLKAVVVEDDRGEAQQISQTDGTAHGAKDELRPRLEVVSAVFVLVCVGGQHEPEPLAEAQLDLFF